MERDKLLHNITNNKKFLFIVPNLIYIYRFLLYYIGNRDIEVLYYEVIIVSIIFFLFNCFIYKIIYKILRDYQKVFFIMIMISIFYLVNVDLITFLFMVVFILILIIIFKKFIKINLEGIIFITSFIVISLFSYSFIVSSIKGVNTLIKIKNHDNNISFKVDGNSNLPNIYYIHYDATMNFNDMIKYFNNNSNYLYNYLSSNDYYINKDASFIGGHRTVTSLAALFNPKYYDNFYKDYLNNLNDIDLGKRKDFDYMVSYSELYNKKYNNEVFKALKKKGYSTVAVSDFNQHTSFNADYFYDFFDYDYYNKRSKTGNFKYIKGNNSNFRKNLYSRIVHIKSFLYNTMLGNLIKDIYILDYDKVDYNDLDLDGYDYISSTDYWQGKAIIKGIDESFKYGNRFVFIDYNLNHLPITFDMNGNKVDDKYMYDLNYYNDNYNYCNYLLVDILKYIKDHDKDSIIILQSDHGIHTFTNKDLMNFFKIDINDAQGIKNSVMSAIYIPDKYKNGDEIYLNNPLNISRYIVNNYVGDNYEYLG